MHTGRFRIAHSPEVEVLTFRAAGFEQKTIGVASLGQSTALEGPIDLGEVLLTPIESAAVVVRDADGQPQRGVRTVWRGARRVQGTAGPNGWIESRAASEHGGVELTTNGFGRASLAIGGPSEVAILNAEGVEWRRFVLRPKETKVVIQPTGVATICFVDAVNGNPIQGLGVKFWVPEELDAVVQRRATDEDGCVGLPPTRRPCMIRGETQVGFAEWTSEWEGVLAISGRGAQLGFSGLRGGNTVTVQVRSESLGLQLVHAGTGDPIAAAPYELALQRMDESTGVREWLRSALCEKGPVAREHDLMPYVLQGWLRFPLGQRYHQRIEQANAHEDTNLVLWVDGFVPDDEIDWQRVLDGWQGPVELEPARRKFLRVLDSEGEPYRGPLRVEDPAHRFVVAEHPGTRGEAQILGPLDWFGDAWQVRLGEEVVTLSGEEIREQDVLTIKAQSQLGSVRVVGVPPRFAGELVAIRHQPPWTLHNGVGTEQGEKGLRWEIGGLAPGAYLVGPPDWVWGLFRHAARPGMHHPDQLASQRVVEVRAGEVTNVDWDPAWGSGTSLAGRIQVTGPGASSIFLVPLYGIDVARYEQAPHVFFGRGRSHRIPLAADGTYRTPEGAPVPSLLMVCMPHRAHHVPMAWGQGGLQLLESIVPGESCQLELSNLHFQWKGPLPEPKSLVFQLEGTPLRYPVRGPVTSREVVWTPTARESNLVVPSVLTTTTQAVFHSRVERDPQTQKHIRRKRVVPIPWPSTPEGHVIWSQAVLDRYPEEVIPLD